MATWACDRCTLENPAEQAYCEVCGAVKPGAGYAPMAACAPMAPSAPAPSAPSAASESALPAPSAPSAPMVPVIVYDAKELARCAWLVQEAVRLEARGADLERSASIAEALFHHRLAITKLSEAADACPDQHPDKALLEDHAADIQLRTVYLESLGAALPILPLDEHVGTLSLTMDLSCAEASVLEDVADLVARSGASGSTADLTESGYQLVAALRSTADIKAFICRLIAADGRQVRAGADSELDALANQFSDVHQTHSLAHLQEAISRAVWVELILDPKKDKLVLAMDLQKEAERFESLGLKEQAVEMYGRSSAILQFVVKHDQRIANEKVKQMVVGRNDTLQVKIAALKMHLGP